MYYKNSIFENSKNIINENIYLNDKKIKKILK
jgi:hypothetical protein